MDNKMSGFLGLAMKAGKIAAGDSRAAEQARKGNAHLIILSCDASENTQKKYENISNFRDIPMITLDIDRYELGRILGREFAVIAVVCDKGFADGILSRNSSGIIRKG